MNSYGDKSSREYINVFEGWKKDQDRFISIDDLAGLMKKIGRLINEGELQDIKRGINPTDNSIFDLKEYMNAMERRNKD